VTAIDNNGKTIAQTTTDQQGYYEIRVPVEVSREQGQAGKVSLNFKLYVGGSSTGTAPVQSETFEPKGGSVAYRDIKVSTDIDPSENKKP
jgi:hypothetical protein